MEGNICIILNFRNTQNAGAHTYPVMSIVYMVVAGGKWTIWQGKNEHFCHSVVTPLPFYHFLLSCASWSDMRAPLL
jgi:hypothetical protein